jgi:hypothetical protein
MIYEVSMTTTAHVTYVSPCSIGCGGHESSAMLATCLQSKRLLRIRDTPDTPPIDVFLTLDPPHESSPPHEGFVHLTSRVSPKPLIWNSTDVGLVLASDPELVPFSEAGFCRSFLVYLVGGHEDCASWTTVSLLAAL